MAKGDVITLQLGSFSNYTCSHLWNLQANCFYFSEEAPFGLEFDHDVFYREGRSLQNKVTYNPRTVLIDLKGSLRCAAWPTDLSYDGCSGDEGTIWDGAMQIHKAERAAHSSKSEELGEADRKDHTSESITKDTWAGYIQNKFHPKSVLISNRYDADDPQQLFNVYNQGNDLWSFEGENFEDRIRWFAEECDRLTGFNVVADIATGFAGFTCKCLELLNDDFSGKTSVVWGLFDVPQDEKYSNYRRLNALLAYNKLQEIADLVLPLSVSTDGIMRNLRPGMGSMDLSPFSGGALLALHVDSVLSSLKLKSDAGFNFSTLPRVLTAGQRKFGVSSMVVQPTKSSRMECLTPMCAPPTQSTATYSVTRACEELASIIVKTCKSSPESTFVKNLRHPSKFSNERFGQFVEGAITAGDFSLASGLYAVQNSTTVVKHLDDLIRREFRLNKMHRLTVTQEDVEEALQAVTNIKEQYSS